MIVGLLFDLQCVVFEITRQSAEFAFAPSHKVCLYLDFIYNFLIYPYSASVFGFGYLFFVSLLVRSMQWVNPFMF